MKFCKIRNVKSPVRGTGKAAGIDFFVPNFGGNKGFIVNPGSDVLIPSGIKMEIPNFRPIIVYKITSDANNE